MVHAVLLTKSGAAFQSARIDANFELAKYLSEMPIELRSVAGRNTKVGLLGLDSSCPTALVPSSAESLLFLLSSIRWKT